LYEILDKVYKEGTTVAGDDFKSYGVLDREPEKKLIHVTVNHSLGQFGVGGGGIHTNGIENLWRLVKRQWFETHRHYRQGHRGEKNIFDSPLGRRVR
jgi:hypothetical protein